MTGILGAATVLWLLAMVLTRVAILRRAGIVAVQFGKTNRSDFFIPPFAVFYFYLIFARVFHWPSPLHTVMFDSAAASWAGVVLCLVAVGLMFLTLRSFGQSFRIGIDTEHPNALVTSGVFAYTRNPHLCRIRSNANRRVSYLAKLDALTISYRRNSAIAPSGAARGSLPAVALRIGVYTVLPTCSALFVGENLQIRCYSMDFGGSHIARIPIGRAPKRCLPKPHKGVRLEDIRQSRVWGRCR